MARYSHEPAPSSGWFFSFPGFVITGSVVPSELSNLIPPPAWGKYDKVIITQGGGDTGWGNGMYTNLKAKLGDYKPAKWDGVCWDWEMVGVDHTSEGFNDLMRATQEAGLINILSSTAEGPYQWGAPSKDATDIDWSLVDYFVPQMYGAAGTLPAEWETYAQYWVDGAGKPNLHGVTFGAIPMEKILWGMPSGQCDLATKFGGSGCVEWAYSPVVKPPPVLV